MAFFRECVPVASAGPARARVLAAVLMLAAALPLAGQIRQQPPSSIKPPDPVLNRMLPSAQADLVIESVTVGDDIAGNPLRASTVATLVVRNAGQADAVFPAGSVIFRAETAPGGATFQPMSAPAAYTIAAGARATLSTSVSDLCASAQPAAVTFVVDPEGRVRETNESNNRKTVAAVYPFSQGDILPAGLRMWSVSGGGSDAGPIPGSSPADLTLNFENSGTGTVLLCPGVTLMRETETPLSAKKGLREVKYTGSALKLFMPGNMMSVEIKGAFQPGDLPPGTYTWKVLLNPDGRIAEASRANNAASMVVQIK